MGYERATITSLFLRPLVFGMVIGSIIGLNITTVMARHDATNTKKALVFAVCQESRMEINGASEQTCGDLQDMLHVEYLCNERNNLMSNHCWTEAK